MRHYCGCNGSTGSSDDVPADRLLLCHQTQKFNVSSLQLLTFNEALMPNWVQCFSAATDQAKHAWPWCNPAPPRRAHLSKGNRKPPQQFELCSTSVFNWEGKNRNACSFIFELWWDEVFIDGIMNKKTEYTNIWPPTVDLGSPRLNTTTCGIL